MSPISRIISSKVDNFSIDFQRMGMSYNLILMFKMISKEGNFQDNFLGGNNFFHSLLQSFVYNSFNFKLCFRILCLIFSKRGETIKFKFIFQLFILIRFLFGSYLSALILSGLSPKREVSPIFLNSPKNFFIFHKRKFYVLLMKPIWIASTTHASLWVILIKQ